MKKLGVTHPVPKKFAERIYQGDKNVFVGKRCLCKVNPGDKFIIYESHGTRAYTGWATIKFIGKMNKTSILRKYSDKLMLSKEELGKYSRRRFEMFVIEFENFEKFKNPVKPKKFVTMGGKYIYEDEFKFIDENKG